MGNLSRFINHSCAPNLAMYCVFVDNVDARTPRLALFARRRIRRGEELTFDYRRNVITFALLADQKISNQKLSQKKNILRIECV